MTFATVNPGLFRLLVIGSIVLLSVSSDRVTDRPVLLTPSSPTQPPQGVDGTRPPLDTTTEGTRANQVQNIDSTQPSQNIDRSHSPPLQDVDPTQASPVQDNDSTRPPLAQDIDGTRPFQDVNRSSLGQDRSLDVMEPRGEEEEEKSLWEEEEEEEEERRQRELRKQREKEEEEEAQRERFSLRQPERETDQGLEVMDSSQESSGFFTEDGEDKRRLTVRLWEETDEVNDTRPDSDSEAMMEYRPALLQTPSPALLQTPSPALQEARQPSISSLMPGPQSGLDAGERDLWEGEEGQASGLPTEPLPGYELSATSPDPWPPTPSAAVAGVLGSTTSDPDPLSGLVKLHGWDEEEEEDEDEEKDPALTQNPTAPEVGAPPSREPLQPGHAHPHGVGGVEAGLEEEAGVSEEMERSDWDNAGHHSPLTAGPSPSMATVMCVDWSVLAGWGYVILNTTENLDCDEFREESGSRLLELVETVFSRRMNSPQGSWRLSLSKTPRHDHQLLMTLASKHGVIATKDVLSMLGEIRKGLHEVGIQNYSAASTCHSRPSQTRSDYGKLFVVLVIIGSVCMVIITSGLIYICWQRRLPKTKTMSRGEELHFVENGCHDNPTLDVTSDSQSEMREKKPSTNGMAGGVAGGVAGGRDEGSRWQVLVNHPGREEEEEDTHL